MQLSPPEVTNKIGRKLKTDQLRIRLLMEERQALEVRCARDRESGHAYAETLSSWLRHHIGAIIASETRVICSLPQERYRELMQLAEAMDQTPEKVMVACIGGIAEMIVYPNRKVPLVVAEFRLRRSYRETGTSQNGQEMADRGL